MPVETLQAGVEVAETGIAFCMPFCLRGIRLETCAAVFLRVTMSEEGEPRVINTLFDVLILGVMSNGLTQMHVDSYVREILIGSIVILAVAVSSFGAQWRK